MSLWPPGSDVEAGVIRAAQLEPTRFGDLYEANVRFVHALAWSRLRDRSAAEEATAETFLRALRGLPRYEPRNVPFRAWLARICINVINDEYARRRRLAMQRRALITDVHEPVDSETMDEIATRAVVHQLVTRLSSTHRLVLELRFADDLSLAEVAQQLGKSVGAVKQLQRRALAELQQLMSNGDTDA